MYLLVELMLQLGGHHQSSHLCVAKSTQNSYLSKSQAILLKCNCVKSEAMTGSDIHNVSVIQLSLIIMIKNGEL